MDEYQIKSVLVPYDFSAVADNALQTAVAICKRQLATLSLIHIIENSYALIPPEAGVTAGALVGDWQRDAGEKLGKLAKDLRLKHDLVVNQIISNGNPADEICKSALTRPVSLIIMGTHGKSALRKFLLGSNAYRVVKNAPCPVMTIPGSYCGEDFRKILFPIRMIPHALDKYEVVRPIIKKNNSNALVAGIVNENDIRTLIEMKALTEYVKTKLEEDNVDCRCEVHYSENTAKHVLEISRKEKPDLIVITATLDESLRDFFLGPYTQDIVRQSHFPVLSIRPERSRNAKGLLSQSIVKAFEHLYQF